MEENFHKNCILTGIPDSFCLPCQTYLKVDDLEVHIESSAHKEALKSTVYVEKYKDEFIRKVKMGYYCEACNILIQTLAKVGVHVSYVSHIDKKSKRYIKQSTKGVVAFDKILIPKQAWHGLISGSCVICTVDYEDENEHLNDAKHIVNLIQSKLELKKDKIIYRMIDEGMVSCLVCNSIITIDSKENHINEHEHLNNYSKCLQSQVDKKMKTKNETKQDETLTTEKEINYAKKDETNSCKNIAINSFENKVERKVINKGDDKEKTKGAKKDIEHSGKKREAESTVDKVKEDLVNKGEGNPDNKDEGNSDNQNEGNSGNIVAMNSKHRIHEGKQTVMPETKETRIVRYIERQKENDEENDTILTHKQVKALARQNHMKYSKKISYCELCNVRMSSSGNIIKEHIEDKIHKERVKTRHIHKTPMAEFIKSEETVKHHSTDLKVINNSCCLTLLSFHMITENLRCQVCEVSLQDHELESHKRNIKHIAAIYLTPVLTNYSDFIREVRPGVYHCGGCNLIEAGIERLIEHLCSQDHRMAMGTYNIFLRSAIEAKRRREIAFIPLQIYWNMWMAIRELNIL